jgi:assimilatory nitrate reductase catalytic subunit
MPRASRVREALAGCPLVIASDAWPTDTTKLAHVVLPAAAWAEKDGTVTNSERRISRQRAFRAAPGEARPDWWMFAQIAQRMGWKEAFAYSGPADIFREHAALSAFENDGRRVFDIGALGTLDDAAYEALAPQQWPCPKSGPTERRLFSQGGFPTPDGRARMVPLAVEPPAQQKDYPLTLNTGRVRDQWHTMTRTGRIPRLMTHMTAPRLHLHPEDARRFGLEDDGLARIESAEGHAVMRLRTDTQMRPGDMFVPMHWTDQFTSSGAIDRLVHARADPLSGQPDLKGTNVRVAPVAALWRGALLRRTAGDPALGETVCWSRVPIAGGHFFEMDGWSPLASIIRSERVLRGLLDCGSGAELVSYSDPKRAVYRYGAFAEGRLAACVFFAPPGCRISEAERATHLLGRTLDPSARLSLLSGLQASSAEGGRTVCSCFSVGETAIAEAIREKKLRTPAEIGVHLRAGTNCGTCIPELKKLLGLVPEVA